MIAAVSDLRSVWVKSVIQDQSLLLCPTSWLHSVSAPLASQLASQASKLQLKSRGTAVINVALVQCTPVQTKANATKLFVAQSSSLKTESIVPVARAYQPAGESGFAPPTDPLKDRLWKPAGERSFGPTKPLKDRLYSKGTQFTACKALWVWVRGYLVKTNLYSY